MDRKQVHRVILYHAGDAGKEDHFFASPSSHGAIQWKCEKMAELHWEKVNYLSRDRSCENPDEPPTVNDSTLWGQMAERVPLFGQPFILRSYLRKTWKNHNNTLGKSKLFVQGLQIWELRTEMHMSRMNTRWRTGTYIGALHESLILAC